MLKCLKKDTTNIFRHSKPTSKVQRMYLACKKLKISRKLSTDWLKSKEQSMSVFGRWNARNNVRVMFLEVKLHEVRSG